MANTTPKNFSPEGAKQNKYPFIIGGIILLIIIAIVAWFMSRPKGYRIIKMLEIFGEVRLDRDGQENIKVYDDMNLQAGDNMRTGANESYCRLVLDEDKYVYVAEKSEVGFELAGSKGSSLTTLNVKSGAVVNELESPLMPEESFEVKTPNATMAVRGTRFRVSVYEGPDGILYSRISVMEGKVSTRLIYPDGTEAQETVDVDSSYETLIYYNPQNSKVDYVRFDANGNIILGDVTGDYSLTRKVDYQSFPEQTLKFMESRMVEGAEYDGINLETIKVIINTVEQTPSSEPVLGSVNDALNQGLQDNNAADSPAGADAGITGDDNAPANAGEAPLDNEGEGAAQQGDNLNNQQNNQLQGQQDTLSQLSQLLQNNDLGNGLLTQLGQETTLETTPQENQTTGGNNNGNAEEEDDDDDDETESETETESESESEIEPVSESETESESESESQELTESESESREETESQEETKSEQESESETQSESASESQPVSESESQKESESEPYVPPTPPAPSYLNVPVSATEMADQKNTYDIEATNIWLDKGYDNVRVSWTHTGPGVVEGQGDPDPDTNNYHALLAYTLSDPSGTTVITATVTDSNSGRIIARGSTSVRYTRPSEYTFNYDDPTGANSITANEITTLITQGNEIITIPDAPNGGSVTVDLPSEIPNNSILNIGNGVQFVNTAACELSGTIITDTPVSTELDITSTGILQGTIVGPCTIAGTVRGDVSPTSGNILLQNGGSIEGTVNLSNSTAFLNISGNGKANVVEIGPNARISIDSGGVEALSINGASGAVSSFTSANIGSLNLLSNAVVTMAASNIDAVSGQGELQMTGGTVAIMSGQEFDTQNGVTASVGGDGQYVKISGTCELKNDNADIIINDNAIYRSRGAITTTGNDSFTLTSKDNIKMLAGSTLNLENGDTFAPADPPSGDVNTGTISSSNGNYTIQYEGTPEHNVDTNSYFFKK